MRSVVIISLGILLITWLMSCSEITHIDKAVTQSDIFTFNNGSPVSSITIYKRDGPDTKQSAYVFEIKPEEQLIKASNSKNYSSFKIMLEPDLKHDDDFAEVALKLNSTWIEKNKLVPADLEIILISEGAISEKLNIKFIQVKDGYHHFATEIKKSGDYVIRSGAITPLNEKEIQKPLMPINTSERNTSSFSTLPRVITNKPSGPNTVK